MPGVGCPCKSEHRWVDPLVDPASLPILDSASRQAATDCLFNAECSVLTGGKVTEGAIFGHTR